MAEKNGNKGTIYQQLNQLFNLDGMGFQESQPSISQSTTPQQGKVVIKGNTPEEIHRKGLELEQKRELQNKYFRTSDRGFQKALQYEAARLPMYMDFEGMEYYPIISSALDLFMEEATTIGINGKMLNIYSNKERIKTLLEEFFYDTVNVNVNLPFWTRNLCKYGDNFTLLYGERKKGITHVKQLVNYEIERFERIQNGKPTVRFKERMTGDEFNIFEIAHFRLLGDDKFLPYGSSVLNKVRRVFRQLCLDANTKIWTPDGFKLIKDITENDIVFSYDYEKNCIIEANIKGVYKTGVKKRYEIRTRHREITLTDDHPILVTYDDGESFTYENIKDIKSDGKLVLPKISQTNPKHQINLGVENYYVKLNQSGVEKAKEINFSGILKRIESLNLNTTSKNVHSFLKNYNYGINRKIKYSDYLLLMNEFNLNLDNIDIYYRNTNKKTILNNKLEFVVTKEMIKFFGFMLGDGWVNEKNVGFALGVYPEQNEEYINLVKSLHFEYVEIYKKENSKSAHAQISSSEFADIMRKLDFKTGFMNKRIPKWVYSLTAEEKLSFIRGMFDADGCDSNGLYASSNKDLIEDLRLLAQTCNLQVGNVLCDKRTTTVFNNIIYKRKISYQLYIKFKEITPDIEFEKIINIEPLENDDVWDIEIDNEFHNFIAEGVVVHNCMAEDAMLTYRIMRAGEKKVFKIDVGNIDEDDVEEYIYKVATKFKKTAQVQPNDGQIDYRFNILGNDEDYFLPVRNANTQTGIETLAGATNLNDINDIEYLRDNLFIGLGIPKPFLSFQDAAGAGKNMAQYDIRFAKKISRIQQALIQELNKMAMIHLFLLGYTGEDLNGFTLTLTNPSTQQEQLKAELLREKAQTYTELTRAEGGIAAMSHTNAKRMIFNMSDREIVDDLKQQKMEKVVMQELQDSPVTIKKSGLFTDIDKRFGEPIDGMPISGGTGGGQPAGGAPMGAPMGGDMGGMPDAGAPMGAPAGGMEAPIGGAPLGGGQPAGAPMMETKLSEDEYNRQVEKLVFGTSQVPEIKNENRQKAIIQENNNTNDKLNKKAQDMIDEINILLENRESINILPKSDNIQDIDIVDIDNIDLNE